MQIYIFLRRWTKLFRFESIYFYCVFYDVYSYNTRQDSRFWISWWENEISCSNEKRQHFGSCSIFLTSITWCCQKMWGNIYKVLVIMAVFVFPHASTICKTFGITGGVPNSITFLSSLHTSVRVQFLGCWSKTDQSFLDAYNFINIDGGYTDQNVTNDTRQSVYAVQTRKCVLMKWQTCKH